MCTLLLWMRAHPRYPVIAAANRDEYLARPASGPRVLCADPLVVGGRDEIAGGTWFAYNAAGFIVALTNRRDAGVHDPAKRSRGMLVIDLARAPSASEARARLSREDAGAFNPFALVIAGIDGATIARAGDDGFAMGPVARGAHALTNWALDARSPAKAAHAFEVARSFAIPPDEDAGTLASRLHGVLADHGAQDGLALCVHRVQEAYGTRSSTLAFVGADPRDTRLFHAEGPPCSATLVDVSSLLRHETRASSANR